MMSVKDEDKTFEYFEQMKHDAAVPFFGDLFGLARTGWKEAIPVSPRPRPSSGGSRKDVVVTVATEETASKAHVQTFEKIIDRKKLLRTAFQELRNAEKTKQKTTLALLLDGNVVKNVFPGGPAHRAGLKKGDVIQAVDNFAPAALSPFIGKYLAAVPDEVGASVFLTWMTEDEQVRRATVEKVDSRRYYHAELIRHKLHVLDKAVDVYLIACEENARAPSLSDAQRSEIQEELKYSRHVMKDIAANIEDDIVAILHRQHKFEDEMLLQTARYEAYKEAHHSRNAENLEQLDEMQELKEILQERICALGLDEMDLSDLSKIRKENEILKEILKEVRDTKATFQYKNKMIMEPREYEEFLRRDPAPLMQVIDEQQQLIRKLQAESVGYQEAVEKAGELTEVTLKQSAEILRLNELLKRYPADPSSVSGPLALRGDWLSA